jgi:hypothetical protein
MKKILVLLALSAFLSEAGAQKVSVHTSEFQNLMFVTEAFGTSANLINPAGLARNKNDDGVLVNYNFNDHGVRDELNFNMSMGDLSLGMQEFDLKSRSDSSLMRLYRLGIAIGGSVLSFGTSNKFIELEDGSKRTRVFSLDAGFVLQPLPFITFAGLARDLDEPEIGGIQFHREYTAGVSFNLLQRHLRFLGQTGWNENTRYIEKARYKVGLAISPKEDFDIILGGIQDPHEKEQFFAMLQVPIWGGIRLRAAARADDEGRMKKYLSSLTVPLQTVSF